MSPKLPEDRSVALSRPHEGVALIEVGGPPPNVSTFGVVETIADRLVEAREGGARICVLASTTPGHWLGHASLHDLGAMFRGDPTSGDGDGWFRAIHELSKTPVVSIAAVNGETAGGGCELGWACDLRVAAHTARFSQPEVMIGVPTGLGGTARLARLAGRSFAAEVVLDGAVLDAERLHQIGVVNRLVDAEHCTATALAWAVRLAGRPPAALAALKQILHESDELPLGEALANEQRRFQEVARSDAGMTEMAAAQARYDAGATLDDLMDPPFDPEEPA